MTILQKSAIWRIVLYDEQFLSAKLALTRENKMRCLIINTKTSTMIFRISALLYL